MASSSTVENYLKAILQAQAQLGPDELVPMGQVATALGVVPGTATTMVKTLGESGLARYEPYAGVRLTPAGEKLAAMVLRRHRLIELFLVQVMGMSWTEVHDEAEHLEHAVSDRLIERIDEMLGRPEVDPHGDPIPDSDGAVRRTDYDTLLTCSTATPVMVQRVSDQSPEFLRFIERNELRPGQTVRVRGRDDVADSVELKTQSGRECTIGARAASKVLVRAGALVLALSVAGGSARPAAAQSAAPFRIADNSFLVEEAFNQEAGVVQTIAGVVRIGDTWTTALTQEWPVPSQRHQLSYSLQWQDGVGSFGFGDALVNYRYQAWTEGAARPAFSPRISLLLPTGEVRRERGLGSYGVQVNLPFSKQAGDVYWHWNAGVTWLPDADGPPDVRGADSHAALTSPFLAASAVYRMRPMVHLMLESVTIFEESFEGSGTSRQAVFTLAPGARGGWDIGDTQIIAGAAVPFVFTGGTPEAGLFLYLSYELPFRR